MFAHPTGDGCLFKKRKNEKSEQNLLSFFFLLNIYFGFELRLGYYIYSIPYFCGNSQFGYRAVNICGEKMLCLCALIGKRF